MKINNKIYYETENEEIFPLKKSKMTIDENYKYIHTNPFYKFAAFVTYRLFATPYAFISFKLFKRIKFHNKRVLKKHKKGGYFIYANHTNQFCDGFCPALICFPKKPHIIVDKSNVSNFFWGKFTKMWGALPVPENFQATKNFYNTIEQTLNSNNPIVIYPEAHLWPYYTKIRNFPITSFRYPVKFNKPVYTFTTTYKHKKNGRKPRIEIYVDGPIYPNLDTTTKQAQLELRNKVYRLLTTRSKLSNYEYVKYIKKEKHD